VYVVSSAEIVVVALLLSPGDWLTRNALLLVMGCAAVVAAAVWIVLERPRPPVSGALHSASAALRDLAVAVLAALALLVSLAAVGVALTLPQTLPDTMLYHLPRAALWKQQHAVAYVANAPDFRVNFFPPGAEIETMTSMILSRGDRFVALPQ